MGGIGRAKEKQQGHEETVGDTHTPRHGGKETMGWLTRDARRDAMHTSRLRKCYRCMIAVEARGRNEEVSWD